MKRCVRTDKHLCRLGAHLIPDMTRDPADQTAAQRLVGLVFLISLFALVAMVPR